MLGKHLHEIRALPNIEVVQWQAFVSWRAKVQEFEQAKAGG